MVDLTPLRSAPILQGLTDSDLTRLGDLASDRSAQRGERLFARDAQAERFFIVRDGRFALTIAMRALGEPIEAPLEEKRALDAFGWSALVHPHRSIYSAYCMEEGEVVEFESQALERLMSQDDRIGKMLAMNLSELIADRVRVMQRLWIDEVEQHMARVNYWTHTDLSASWTAAVKRDRGQGMAWRLLQRRSQQTIGR